MATLPVITHAEPDSAWLARLQEDILEPALPIIDPHHHLWERSGGYLLDDILADTGAGHHVTATVFVQCGYAHYEDGAEALRPVGETVFCASVAAEAERRGEKTRVCAGIVGTADLRLGAAVDEVLEAHIDAGGGRFRGIRHIAARHSAFLGSMLTPPQHHLLADARFREGFARLGAYGLSFDAWVYHPQIAEVADLARAFPDIPIVLNHIGAPLGVVPYVGRRNEVFADWYAAMRDLAGCPNVVVKLGGMGMVLMGFTFHKEPLPPSSGELAAAWRPYMGACIELFGADRCMFESNFPVDKGMCSYAVLWNAYKRIAAGVSATEKAALFHDTAARFYRLQA